MKHVLVIAGSDPSGGAGVQADLATLKDFGVPALFSITALTAQNEERVLQIHPTPADVLTQQLSAACEGKEVGATKIGMIASHSNVTALIWFLNARKFPHVVIDPILHSSSGTALLESKAHANFRQQLLPLATVLTPNLPEASALVGFRIYNEEAQIRAVKQIYEEMKALRAGQWPDRPLAVIVKGGHLEKDALDILYDGTEVHEFRATRIPGRSPRGTGCRFSSAIAAGLAKGWGLKEAVQEAKNYLTSYIELHH
ncbi:MAG: bifunctional hydroxymethylpyrimidine kinase/phosphomethylpyrimidine kinase [Deltaproteobacteria bacterium RIFCSPLOWO2_01_44_7]|nr:MAG: bifunctional hydroxymethylpyrimidine kinase/phosphomethylpyrimidine kinase [Deltaproteobacteria bacterium RIFCSPHIGHO2_01_FULL_43_49]OGQ14546.1 MAG: bifunctional hydroxymethylpyrimidine kinase/phosphomethylpyrimidine kinase [Deltaproteobacteria bacterium RIFCSPHIGHO2_02_FULL_44_53]OGQ27932.1 MAG: bifunctional hydroxymethylpyrimidine kinase/phosphomethylpyrimidine kinase [Deltaproteobacteria bacterium RIFCSPHIGHO2_12_FULL_44_21]OGQ31144.1 MAG: bifunctional hydroxymethylpyrimidine kinase/p